MSRGTLGCLCHSSYSSGCQAGSSRTVARQVLPSRLTQRPSTTPRCLPLHASGEKQNASISREKIPEEGERPAALLELLGRSRGSVRGSSGGGGGDAELTAEEASTVCKYALSLIGPAGGSVPADGGGDAARGGSGDTEEDANGSGSFPLDIDQEVIRQPV